MSISLALLLIVVFAFVVALTLTAFKLTGNKKAAFIDGFAPALSVGLFAILLYTVDEKSPFPHFDDVTFSLAVAIGMLFLVKKGYHLFWVARAALRKIPLLVRRVYRRRYLRFGLWQISW